MSDENKVPWLEPAMEEQQGESFLERNRMGVIAAGLVLILAFIIIIWQVYSSDGKPPAPGDVPLVRAEEGPTKIAPDDPGGMEVKDRDKLVYDRVGGNDDTAEPEYLRPGPETPMDKPDAPDEVAPASPPAPPPPPSTEADVPVKESKSASTKSVGDYLIQLGAFSERERALKAWETIKGKHPDILSTLEPEIVSVKGAKGTLYRLQAGRMADRESAETLCKSLTVKKQPCMVVGK